MSGLIWSALGQSIGNAASTVGNYMARDAEREDRQEERRREREEDARRQAERDSLYRRTADQQGAVRTGTGSSGPRELTDDEQSAMAGMTRPEYDAYWGSVKTGDKSAFKRETTRYSRLQDDTAGPNDEFSDATSRRDAMLVEEKIKDYPPGFEAEFQAKVAKLAEIRKISVYNKDYDDVTRGERTKQEITRSDEAIANPDKAGGIGQGMAAGAGRGAYKVQGNTKLNEFTGEAESTELGESIEEKNRRKPAAKPAAPVSIKDVPYERLTAQAETLRKAINEASGDRKKMLETQFDDVMGELRRRRPSGAGASGAAPAPSSAASGVTKGGSKWTQVN
jgi:hypothetical protein